MKITIVRKAQPQNVDNKYCPFVIESLVEPRK
jgi:hypothetical protein